MKIIKPIIAGLAFATLGSTAFAQVMPMQQSCLAGEQFVNGQCRPITGNNIMNNVDELDNTTRSEPGTTGSVGGDPSRTDNNSGNDDNND